MLAPEWRRVRIGPYLRGERDKRQYHKLFRSDRYVTGARRLAMLAVGRRVYEDVGDNVLKSRWPTVVRFTGMRDYFLGLTEQRDAVLTELRSYARPELLPQTSGVSKPFMAVHVRRGDFSMPRGDELLRGNHSYKIPIEWYVAAITTAQKELGKSIPVIIFTDGDEEEMAPILECGATLHTPSTAITDLLVMSSAAALITSASSFSMWASYLAQCPTIWHRGQLRGSVTPTGAIEVEWMPGNSLSPQFISALSAKFRS